MEYAMLCAMIDHAIDQIDIARSLQDNDSARLWTQRLASLIDALRRLTQVAEAYLARGMAEAMCNPMSQAVEA